LGVVFGFRPLEEVLAVVALVVVLLLLELLEEPQPAISSRPQQASDAVRPRLIGGDPFSAMFV